jgi:hypothetical protein
MSKVKLFNSLRQGWEHNQLQRPKEDAEKNAVLGVESRLRGGNSGCFIDGKVAGYDPRKTILRYMGIEMPSDFETNLMFDPIQWQTSNGTYVTGRPDIVVGEYEEYTIPHSDGARTMRFKPEYGVEEKLICSPHSAMKHANFAKNAPKTEHMIQSAHYSWQNNYLPWVIHYTSRVNWPYMYGEPSKSNPKGWWTDPDHPAINRPSPGARPFRITPFQSFYDLTWEVNDTRTDGVALIDGRPTAVTAQGIKEYYDYCARCIANKIVPKVPSTLDLWGDEFPLDKNEQLKYYEFSEAREDDGWDVWINDCRQIMEDAK